MGLGDNLMATGLARGAAARGKRIAFGDRRRILWDQHSAGIFRGNPNIARPGEERTTDLEWVPFYKGHRIYNRPGRGRWIRNRDFRAVPGEVFFEEAEREHARRVAGDYVVIEPNLPAWKKVAANKDWGRGNWQQLANYLRLRGVRLIQFATGKALDGVEAVSTGSFRDALAILANARLYIGPEGGLHHGAAAVNIPAVVIFGGFIPPEVTGYSTHANMTGSKEFCGSTSPCRHCRQAMENIRVDVVYEEAMRRL
jgi:hypothetical protein